MAFDPTNIMKSVAKAINPKVAMNTGNNTGSQKSSTVISAGNNATDVMDSAASMPSGLAQQLGTLQGFVNANNAGMLQNADYQNKLAMDFNAAEAAKNREWQEFMSNTAHQREVADLKAAGLNPVLSAMGGNGAAVTSGDSASISSSNGAGFDTAMSTGLLSLLGTAISADATKAAAATNAGAVLGAAQINKEAQGYTADKTFQNAQDNLNWNKQTGKYDRTKDLLDTKTGLIGQFFGNLQQSGKDLTGIFGKMLF